MVKVNYELLPVKAHFFFFMAAMGPILPFLPVFGKQLGLSEVALGLITSLLPILFLLAKPVFGFILDYFQSHRKAIFIALVATTSVFFALLYIVPAPDKAPFHQDVSCEALQQCLNQNFTGAYICQVKCNGSRFSLDVLPLVEDSYCYLGNLTCSSEVVCDMACEPNHKGSSFYMGPIFITFAVLMCLGSIGYNVTNSVSDAICFDVLGDGGQMHYGKQRVWGTIGFGVSALFGGYLIDWWSGESNIKDYTPAFVLSVFLTGIDLFCCSKLKLPKMQKSENILKDVLKLIRQPHISTFLLFATFVGICDSFIMNYLFWYLEDLALATGSMANIKLLEGLTIAAETLGGEVVFFPLSGRILKKVGYGHCLSLCFFAYFIRLGLLSLLPSPWWVLPIELVMQGPTYALCYTTIVAYASAVSPPGTSATMQGIVAGMDDGFGFAVGSLIGGFLYRWFGGAFSFKLYSYFALTCSALHFFLFIQFFSHRTAAIPKGKRPVYKSPEEAAELAMGLAA